jgi:hypothetical protein
MTKQLSRFLGIAMSSAMLVVAVSSAHAQTAAAANTKDNDIAVLDSFKGSVMVLKDKDYVNALKDMKLFDGDRVIVLDGSEAVVYVTTRGQRCRIDLKEDQSFTVRDKECAALLLTVQSVPVGTVPGSVVASTAAISDSAALLIGGGIVTGAAIYGWNHPKASSD